MKHDISYGRFSSEDIERELPTLRRYARSLTHDTDKANDLVQSTVLKALANQDFIPGTDFRANFRYWLVTIMHNKFVDDATRDDQRRKLLRRNFPVVLDRSVAAATILTGRPATDALDERDLERAIGRLSNKHQDVIRLSAKGAGTDEIAAGLDLPVGTARSQLSRARDHLWKLTNDGVRPPIRARRDPATLVS
jgi:RNA polymerase sigma-70 factor (ECF subfamily)